MRHTTELWCAQPGNALLTVKNLQSHPCCAEVLPAGALLHASSVLLYCGRSAFPGLLVFCVQCSDGCKSNANMSVL